MRVKCLDRTAGDVPFKLDVGREYVVLALEAYAGPASEVAKSISLPAGLWVFVGLEGEYVWAPISCFEVIDPKVSGEGTFVPECRKDPRWARQVAAGTGYVPYTMAVAPLIREGSPIGCLSILDRRDGGPYLREDLVKVALFADLAVVALDLDSFPLSSSGGRTLLA